MARTKKAVKPPEPKPLRQLGFKASTEWAEWAERLAKHQRTTVAGVIDRALMKLAEAEGFDEPPPERVP